MSYSENLNEIYDLAMERKPAAEYIVDLGEETVANIELLVSRSESNKGIVTVFVTLMLYKYMHPEQDIRFHQAQLPNGFAGRGIDQQYVTPFMKKMSFPAMAESGWLTRSLEQPHPYTLAYPGKIKPENVKNSFLSLINDVEVNKVSSKHALEYLFKLLIKQRDELKVELAKPHSLSIEMIVKYLEKHFTYKYSCAGASRLPTLAIYAAYQCMITQVARYEDKTLCEVVSHNSADTQSGRIGDIDVNNTDGSAFEGVEIKHEIRITAQLVLDAYEKFKIYNTDRYYLLTTANMEAANWKLINDEVERINQLHGCQVIVNGVYTSLKYYLRLLKDPAEFIDKYVELLKVDGTVKFQHKIIWNDIVSGKV